jgi:hypothetical protein
MAITLAVGTVLQIASAYAAPLAFTGATNAAETVLSMASTTGLAIGDFVELNSAWGLVSGRTPRIKAVTANTSITLEGVDTLDTSKFPGAPTGAVGTVRKITSWVGLSQLTSQISIGGGDQQYADVTTLDDRTQRQIPTVRSPLTAQFNAYFDASLPWVAIVKAVSDASTVAAFRMIYPNGGRTVGNAYWSMTDVPTVNDSTLRTQINLAFSALPITYAT